VVVQALDPDTRCLRHAAAHDSSGFLADELRRRQAFAYPPYGHLIRVVCSAEDAGPEHDAAAAVRELIAAAGVPVLGPAALFRRQGRHRAQLVVRSAEREPAIAAVRQAVEAVAGDRDHQAVSYAVDVDPQ
jgi:primosomal protein N' (replication factor Y)